MNKNTYVNRHGMSPGIQDKGLKKKTSDCLGMAPGLGVVRGLLPQKQGYGTARLEPSNLGT